MYSNLMEWSDPNLAAAGMWAGAGVDAGTLLC